MGRPSTYTETIAEEVISLMATGLSLTAAMAELGYHRQTAYDWIDAHPGFSDAVKLGQAKRQLFLERRLLKDDIAGPANTATIFALKNTGTGDWRDKQEVEHSGEIGATQEQRDAAVAAATRANS
jgi:hypothetical protein